MKVLIIFALALALACSSAFKLHDTGVDLEGRITNGQDAAVGQFPYQIALSMLYTDFKMYMCGGSLISENWVLTAAHCVYKAIAVNVSLGATLRTSPEVTFTVFKENIIVHSDWDPQSLRNDIALIEIPPVTFSDTIQPVDLPALSSSYSTYEGDSAITSGWGRYSDDSPAGSNKLQYVVVDVIPNYVCRNTFPMNIETSNICISTTGGVSTCNGDSGGPLVSASSGTLIGVTSFGHRAGCEKGYPAAFTRVTSFLDWIVSNTDIVL